MTTTNEDEIHHWQPYGYRIIPDFPHYVMSARLDVWSMSRLVRCKGGDTRRTTAKQLRPDCDGRVTLSHDGRRRRFYVEKELFPLTWIRPRRQAWCANHHPLMPVRADLPAILKARIGDPHVSVWGTGNRICRRCPPSCHADTYNAYSLDYGVAGMPDYTSLPAQPKPRNDDRFQLEELNWIGAGFIISERPLYSCS